MTSDRKKPSAGFWITVVLVAVLIGYPLSFGATGWVYYRFGKPWWMYRAGATVYAPLWWAWDIGPDWFQRGMMHYGVYWWPPR